MNEDALPLRSHLLELRRRMTYAAISVVVTTAIAFVFHQQILRLLMVPARQFKETPLEGPVFTSLAELISIAFKASLLVGMFASLPFVLYQIAMFVAPGLNRRERIYLYSLMPASLLAFILGAAFGYQILFPPMVDFLLNFGNGIAVPMISISSYINLMISLLFWMGIIFELPVVIFFMAKIGLVSSGFLGRHRRYAVVIAFILGALITPTFDPINQSLVAAPIIVLYELSIWLAKLAARGRKTPNLEPEQGRQ